MRTGQCPHPFGVRACLSVLLIVALGACDAGQQDELASAIVRARYDLAAINPGGTSALTPDARAQAYSAVAQRLRGAMRSGSPAEQAAASLLLAQADQGLAGIAISNARGVDAQIVHLLGEASWEAGEFRALLASAESLESTDAGPGVAELSQRIADLTQQIEAAQSEIDGLNLRVSELREKIARKLSSAEQMRLLERDIRQRMVDSPVASRAELAQEANTYRRQADAHEKDAAWLEAEMQSIEPLIRQRTRAIESLRARKRSLDDSVRALQDAAAAKVAEGRAVRARAGEHARACKAGLEQALSLYDDQLTSLFDVALEKLQSASSSLGRARNASRGGSGAGKASVEHLIASVHLEQAQIGVRIAGALEAAGAEPAPPGVGSVTARATEFRNQAEDAFAEASRLLEETRSAYQALNVRGPAQERLNALAVQIDELRRSITGEEPLPDDDDGADDAGQG